MTNLYRDPFGPPWKCCAARTLLHWEGSIWQFFWVEWALYAFFSALCITAYYLALEETPENDHREALSYALGFTTSRLQAALSLMLGFYTGIVYNRWWKVRDIEGVVIGRINDIAVQIGSLIRDTHCNPHSKTNPESVRSTLIRWMNLSHALAVGELYEKPDNAFSSLEKLLNCGMLKQPEYDYFISRDSSRSRYVAPFVWFLDLVAELKENGDCGVDVDTVMVLAGNVTRIRGSLADLYMYRNVPVPLAYRQLVNFTVRVYMVILAVATGLDSDTQNKVSHHYIYYMLIPFSFEYFLFVGWLTLADSLGNPFRRWADEFEWESYVTGTTLSSRIICNEFRQGSTPSKDLKKGASTQLTEEMKCQADALAESPFERLQHGVRDSRFCSNVRRFVAGH